MMGGNVNGKKIMGTYPNDLTEQTSDLVMKRGRVVPTTPYDSIWNGVAQWMGITEECDLDYILPNRHNFPRCSLFTDMDLFNNGIFPHEDWCNKEVQTIDPTSPEWCSQEVQPTDPTTSPSAAPSLTPSSSPSTSEPSASPSAAPSALPSGAPIHPSAMPSMTPSSTPSTSEPSQSPSSVPSPSPSTSSPSMSLEPSATTCADSPTEDWYYIKKDKKKDCTEIAKDPNKRCDKERDDVNDILASEGCPLTCGTCTLPPTSSPTAAPSLSESPTTELEASGGDFCAALAADEANHCGEEKDGEPKVMMCYHNHKKGHTKSKCESVSDIQEKYNDPEDKMMLHCGCCIVPTEISADEQDDKHCSVPDRKKQRRLNLRPRGA